MSAPNTVRVVVIDPQPMFRYGLRRLLDETDNLRVVGEGAAPADAVQGVRQNRADVLVVNPGIRGSGLEALKGLGDLPKPVRCIVVTNGNHTYLQFTSLDVHVAGVLPRDSPGRAFVDCIEDVMRNQLPCGAEVTAWNASLAEVKSPYGLTRRESQIVCAVASCASNKDIAAQFSIAEDTVKHHLSSIFNKVGVDSRLELAVFALYHGIVEWT
jgi:DNA-binding NarL/FixJ family response regulator